MTRDLEALHREIRQAVTIRMSPENDDDNLIGFIHAIDAEVFALAYRAGVEDAAKVCDRLAEEWRPSAERNYTQDDACAEACAELIRTLIGDTK
jgi:hypothetical protein